LSLAPPAAKFLRINGADLFEPLSVPLDPRIVRQVIAVEFHEIFAGNGCETGGVMASRVLAAEAAGRRTNVLSVSQREAGASTGATRWYNASAGREDLSG
jgi:hypothetical protein